MRIVLNGEPHALDGQISVAGLLAHLGFGERRVAVEVNREIVPRSRHDSHLLNDGDQVELVHAMGGG
ncbi:MAG: sulfur carrier protein ThiS [Lysobacteraceae bacterium]|jgi:sulfur carrier protein|uniref:sulfur carrier protein ThiS n=1 Tax=Denitratimonas sp. CY0512 TaxID=3131940 RepID=UPI00169B307C|nr:sulfur carrier protein ThiS [Gammaproteobacteria bacterium]